MFAHGAECDPSENENFLTFFFRFSNDKTFATSRTAYPLKMLDQKYGIDEMGEDLSSTTRSLRTRQQDAKRPGLSALLQENSLIAKVHEKSANATVVQVFGENSEWGQTYHFARNKNKCWFLRELREHSISNQHWVEKQEFAPMSHLVPHFFIKPDLQSTRMMLRVLDHLSFIQENMAQGDLEDVKTELGRLFESLEANPDYAIEDRDQLARELRDILALYNKGQDVEGTSRLGKISRALWTKVE
ncbi:MAG: hypothetical protein HY938_04855 [Nitrosomonadales bacterium]|nr:hypothetical protein [Nitrosomonadales bacterium]